ncbi:hypothetical protein Tsubulata_026819 [Turnera subulata]|uniref:Uncharacterized protein n=1 Tax=Turnera subulata TaxID=218843 RepID=A0A9Q0J1E9_9ROSI|nr:hypothetical protein Tsubulata_026819 [Turnera subulata]
MALLVHSPEISTAKIVFNQNPKNLKRLTAVRGGDRVGSSVRLRVSGLGQNVTLYGQFSAPVKPDTKRCKEEEERRNYYVNMGYAIRTLREEFPALFCKEPSFDIYREDIVFKDPLNSFSGIENYKSICWNLRLHGRIFFRALWIDIISISQPVEDVIMVRWIVHGLPRVPWESRARFDGLSEYKLDRNGKIFQHRVDNITFNSPPKFRMIALAEMIEVIGCSSTPKPTYFEASSEEH